MKALDWRKQSLHVHTLACDGKQPPEVVARSAYGQKLQALGFSGHSYLPGDDASMAQDAFPSYCKRITKLKGEYTGEIWILLGLEWDSFSPGQLPPELDYWIGSVHYIRGPKTGRLRAVDDDEAKLRRCIAEDFDGDGLSMAAAYFAQEALMAKRKPTILGHFDLVKKFNRSNALFDETSPVYRAAALDALAQADPKCSLLEINTGGMARGWRKDPYPSDFLLRAWKDMGGKIIITADAHEAGKLTYGYAQAAQAAKDAGYTDTYVFNGKGWVPVQLELP